MTADPVTVAPDADVARGRARDRRARPQPPARRRARPRLVGLVTRVDVLEALTRRGLADAPMPVRALARVDLGAIERNVARLRAAARRRTALCAVVKADGYGHGAVAAARAALAGGAAGSRSPPRRRRASCARPGSTRASSSWARSAPRSCRRARRAGADVVAWRASFVERRGRARAPARASTSSSTPAWAASARATRPRPTRVAERVAAAGGCELAGLMTHFATADERGDAFFGEQLARFRRWAQPLRAALPAARCCTPPTAPRRCATRPRTSTWCAAAWRSTGSTRSARTRPRTASSPRSSCAPTSPTVKPLRAGRERRLRAPLRRRRARRAIATRPDRLRRRLAARR